MRNTVLALKIRRDFGELGERSLKVFDYLKLVRCPRSLDPTLVTLPSMSLIPFAPFSGDVGIGEIDAVFEAGFVASANLKCFRCDPDFPTVQLLQYLSFLPAIFRGLLQELRRALR